MALAIAETTAAMPTIRAAMADGGAGGEVQRNAQQVIGRTGASYVAVIDRQSIRDSHSLLGPECPSSHDRHTVVSEPQAQAGTV
jgi:sensor histidine kinase regulating citrate/malate metabolism